MWRLRPAVIIGLLAIVLPAIANAQSFSGDVDKFELNGSSLLLFDGSFSYGGEADALNAKLVIGGTVDRKIDQIQAELTYSRAIGDGFNAEAGVRHEFRSPGYSSYAVVGLSGKPSKSLALESYVLVSSRGDAFAEFKVVCDQPLFGRLKVQPRLAFNLSAQDVPGQEIGAGPVGAELGIRLRYETSGLVTPYIGISHQRLLGRTARLTRDVGHISRSTHLVLGFSSTF